MFKSGKYINNFMNNIDEKRIQSTGIDITVGDIFKLKGTPFVKDKNYDKGERSEIKVVENPEGPNYYHLKEGRHIIVYDEKIKIPESHVGYVFPRSRLMRCGAFLCSAMWDPGYEGIGEGLLLNKEMKIEENCGIGKLGIIEADTDDKYSGTHQEERI